MVRAKGSSALRQCKVKGDGWGPVVCFDNRQNDRKNTRLDIPYGDGCRDSNIVYTFTFGKGRGVGVSGP